MASRTLPNFIESKLVGDHMAAASENVGRRSWKAYMAAVMTYLAAPGRKLDSPLEAAFEVWWFAEMYLSDETSERLSLQPQVNVVIGDDRFRMDFEVVATSSAIYASKNWRRIGIELDGHEFHERTKEQAQRRNYRDRVLQANGWQVFHFSFSEFNQDPYRCVSEVIRFAIKQWFNADAEVGA